jgi:hypothetical protein
VPVGLPRRRRIISPGEWLREEIAERRRAREETLTAATVVHGASRNQASAAATWTASASFTPAAGDLLVIFVAANSSDLAPGVSDTQGLGWTVVAQGVTGPKRVTCLVSNTRAAAVAMTFTMSFSASCAGVAACARVAGMTRAGASAVRQAANAAGAAAGTPVFGTFGVAVLTANATIGGLVNGTNPATVTPPVGWTELLDDGVATPTGFEYNSRNSGATATATSYGSTSATAWATASIELDISAAPKSLVFVSRVARNTLLRR